MKLIKTGFKWIFVSLLWGRLGWGFAFAQTNTPADYLREGKEKMAQQNYRSAIISFNISLEMEPSVEAYIQLALAKRMTDDLVGALNAYDGAITLDPNDPVVYNNRGNLNDELKKTVDALKDYEKAIRLDPVYTNAYYNKAIAHYNLKEYPEAKADFEKVTVLAPDDAEAYIGLGLVQVKLNEKDAACASFTKARQLNFTAAEEYLKQHCQ
jgi:tetratricopeptide (TPR) repeat protein